MSSERDKPLYFIQWCLIQRRSWSLELAEDYREGLGRKELILPGCMCYF